MSQQKTLNFSVLEQRENYVKIRYDGRELSFEISEQGYLTEAGAFFETFEALMMNSFPTYQDAFMQMVMRKLQ